MATTPRSVTRTSGGIHAWAIGLTAALFTLFLIAAGLYARYGHRFVLRVYETQQIARGEERPGRKGVIVYEDYLRVDPSSLRVRDLLVNRLLALNAPDEALSAADAGVAAVPAADKPIARLLVARAQLAAGKLDVAAASYNAVLRERPDSAEAQYGLAHIHAARGQFEDMRASYAAMREDDDDDSTDSFRDARQRAKSLLPNAGRGAAASIVDALALERLGRIDEALAAVRQAGPMNDAPAEALFWRGVAGETEGNALAAIEFYRRAAQAGNPLAIEALARLQRTRPGRQPPSGAAPN